MNILFLTIGNVTDLSSHEIYPDLLRELNKNHNIYVACGRERRLDLETELTVEEGINVLRIRIGNITKTGLLEKGISTLTVERKFRKAIKKFFNNIRFDLIMYSTPPITFSSLIGYLKRRDNAKTYLMLKDIFPQNAVDIGMFGKKSPIYRYFRHKEHSLYRNSDNIGCMSKANIAYLLEHNSEISPSKVELCPNALEMMPPETVDTHALRAKYAIPDDRTVFLFGGNLGKPQGIDFFISCLRREKERKDVFFVIAGSGTEFEKIRAAITEDKLENVVLLEKLSTEEYNKLTSVCDVGLIFLDFRFTIPNYPSRLLSYMQKAKPVLAATDRATDLRDDIEAGKFGWWCPSDDIEAFDRLVAQVSGDKEMQRQYGINGQRYMETNFNVSECAKTIVSHCKKKTLIVSQCFYPSVNRGGPAVSVTNLAKALSEKMDISVLTASYESGSKEMLPGVTEGKNRLFCCNVYYTRSKSSKILKKYMHEISPDTVYISSLFSAEYTLPALFYARKHHLKAVLAPRGELQEAALKTKRQKKIPYLVFLKLSGLVKHIGFHATCTEEAEQIKKHFKNAKITVAQNVPSYINEVCRTRTKTEGGVRAVAVCRVHPIKGLLRAIEALQKASGSVSYDIYGPIEDEAYYQRCLKAENELPKTVSVRFHNAVQPEKLPEILSNADCFLLPTQTENFGNAIVEALLCGCPAVISNGTPWKMLKQCCAGMNADTTNEYTDAINRISEMNEQQWQEWSENAKRYIRERLNTEETVSRYIKMLGGTDETSVCTDKTLQ